MGEQGDLLLIKANPEKLEIVTRYEPGEGENQIKFKHPFWSAPVISNGKLFVRGRLVMAICFALGTVLKRSSSYAQKCFGTDSCFRFRPVVKYDLNLRSDDGTCR